MQYSKDIALRFFLLSISFGEVLMLPLLMGREEYASFEYLKNALFIIPLVLLGGQSGYNYIYYTENKNYYNSLLVVGTMISFFGGLVFAAYFDDILLIIPCILICIFTIAEQKLKIQKLFSIAFFFKPLISLLAILGAAAIYFYEPVRTSPNDLIVFIFAFAFMIWCSLAFSKDRTLFVFSLNDFLKDISRYSELVRRIFAGVLATMVLTAFIFIERYYILKIYPQSLAVYSLAFNLAQLLIMCLTTLSYMSGNLLGEKLKTIRKRELKKYFLTLLLIFIILYSGLMIFVLVLQMTIYDGFVNLLFVTGIISFFKGFVFLVGIFTPLAVYNNFNKRMLICIATLFFISNLVAYFSSILYWSVEKYIFVNGVVLLIYPLFNLDIIFRKIKVG